MPFIDLEQVHRANPQTRYGLPMRARTSGSSGTAQFILGYLCAIAFKLGMTIEEIQQHYADLRKEIGARYVTPWMYADRLHKIIEERIAQLPK